MLVVLIVKINTVVTLKGILGKNLACLFRGGLQFNLLNRIYHMKFIMAKNVLAMAVNGGLLCYSLGGMGGERFYVDGYEGTLYDNGAAGI
ncbi:hypothetical protein UC41_29230, partial [Escherichia coli]